jgi:hypothetical protein
MPAAEPIITAKRPSSASHGDGPGRSMTMLMHRNETAVGAVAVMERR